MEQYKEIERTIIKTYRKELWSKFAKAVKEYHLINEGDHIAVCISGGKDSFLMAKLFQEINRHSDYHFEARYIVMDPGYKDENIKLIKENAEKLNIPIEIHQSNIFECVTSLTEGSPCYLCARMRRGNLYSIAKSIGCNKIALGHHFNDVIETSLLNIFYGSEIKTMLPKLHSKNFEGMELIRPMYLIHEKDIITWAKHNELRFLNCACKFTEESSIHEELSKRKEMKKLISELKKTNPNVDNNIFKALDNVNINGILKYKKDDKVFSFLDEY